MSGYNSLILLENITIFIVYPNDFKKPHTIFITNYFALFVYQIKILHLLHIFKMGESFCYSYMNTKSMSKMTDLVSRIINF